MNSHRPEASGGYPLGLAMVRFLREFRCSNCYGEKAYRSRYRGLLEKALLPFLLRKPVRCERCYHRRYVFRTVPVLEPGAPVGKLDSQSPRHPSADSRVA